ncbi:MAG: Flp pilus assembly complex ATPase component TadA [Planctomycetota bacterium]|nr:Flp pilus assembly complex ATPase component TadA [Planctomycetota bacterium]
MSDTTGMNPGPHDLDALMKDLEGADDGPGDPFAESEVAPPAVRVATEIVRNAIDENAEEIHLEPGEHDVRVRYRTGGVLRTVRSLPKSMRASLTARLKIIANLDIAERRRPQNGRVTVLHKNAQASFVLETLPTPLGEKLFFRRIEDPWTIPALGEVDFSAEMLARYRTLLEAPNGLILHAGPSQGGRDRILRAAMRDLPAQDRNLITVEEPVLGQLPGVTRTEVCTAGGFGLSAAIHAAIRQRPEALMIGEIRDREKAEQALDAALGGTLVLAGLNVPTAAAAVQRLRDMGLDSYLVADALRGVCAHHALRRTCRACEARGCAKCHGTGGRGTLYVHELLTVDRAVAERIRAEANESALLATAREAGFVSLHEDAAAKVQAGETSEREVRRVLGPRETP